MYNVTDDVSNPFGMRPPCPHECQGGGGRRAVFGYGDANADFHVIGDHPGIHGGAQSGIPFTGSETVERIHEVLIETGFLDSPDAPESISNCYLSYLYLCCVQAGETLSEADYDRFEPFFDAEVRAIAADVLLPVGARATTHVLSEYTAQYDHRSTEMDRLHAQELRGRGFLVLPMKDPHDWTQGDKRDLVNAIEHLLTIDYHQMVDLGRFIAGGDPYFVR